MTENKVDRAIKTAEKQFAMWEESRVIGCNWTQQDEMIDMYNLAISALRAQSDAEKKIERVRELCLDKQKVLYDTEYCEGYVNGWNQATKEILSILSESNPNTNSVPVITHGSMNNVKLTDEELEKLRVDFSDTANEAIEFLSLWLADKGDKSKAPTHNATIRRWVIGAVRERKEKESGLKTRYPEKPKQNFEGVTYTDEQLKGFEPDPEEYLKKLQAEEKK